MNHPRTHYEVLGITPKAPAEIVSAVYRAWMHALRAHPDLGGDEDLAKLINIAYETLRDPERRSAYDAKLLKEGRGGEEEARRRVPRVAVDAPIAFCIPPDGRWLPAQAVDASSLGLKIRTAEDLCLGMHVSIAFPGSPAPAAEAQIRWTRDLGSGGAWRVEAGVEFFTPVPDVLKRLCPASSDHSGK